MPMTPSEERSPEEFRARALQPIDNAWKDEFVESLLRELRRQLQQIQNAPAATNGNEAGVRSQNVQALARIERSLDRLLRIQEARELKRDLERAVNNDDACAALERRLDQLLIEARAEIRFSKADEE